MRYGGIVGLGYGSDGGGGAGFTLGPETNEFTSVSARNTYATANPDWLADYDANPSFLVAVTVSSTTTFYRRNGSAWENVTPIIREQGAMGLPGTNASQVQVQFSIDGTNYTATPSTTNPTTHIRISVDGGTTFTAFQLDQPVDGTDGTAGTNAPQLQVEYSTDGTNYTSTPSTTAETTHLGVSVDGGTNFVTFEIPAGPKGPPGSGGGISEAAVITLIEERDDVIDGTPENIPDASVDQKLKLAPDNSGVVRTLVEKIHYAVARTGTFSVYTHAHYRGPFAIAPYPGTDTDDVFYHTSHEHFEKVTLISAGNYQWRTTSFAIALGSDAEWLGHQPSQAIALAQIGTFDNTKSYYAYTSTDQNIMLLDNSSYVAGSGESRTYEWRSIIGDTAERVAILEDYTPSYWAQTIDEPTIISGDDTETIESFDVGILDSYLDAGSMAYAQLIFEVKLEKVTNLRVDSTIRIKHGTATIHSESVPLQNANTEFTSTIKVNVDDVSDGITVEIQTENSDDTTQDVEVSEVKLGILAGMSDGINNVAPADFSGTNFWTALIDGVREYRNGYTVSLVTETANTSNISLRINSLSYRSLRDATGAVIPAGAIASGQLIIASYHSDTNTWRSTFTVPTTGYHAAANPRLFSEATNVGGDANGITLTHSPVITTIGEGDVFEFVAEFDNTAAAVTIAVDSISAITCKRLDDTALQIGDIKDGQAIRALYDGTNFLLNINVAGGTSGVDGADGRFRVVLYQNKSGTAPTAPTNITYTFATEALANLGDWSETRTAPSSGETTYQIIAPVDPDTTDTSVTLSFNTPVALLTGGELEPTSSRRESITFQANSSNVVFGTNADPLTAITTNPIAVRQGTGAAEIMTGTSAITGGGTAITIAQADTYVIGFRGVFNEQNSEGRAVPGIDIYEEADTIGTDTPIASIHGHYGRNQTAPSDKRFKGVDVLTIDSDNTNIKVVPVSLEDHGSADAPFRLAANGVVTITRFGGGGLTEADVEDFVSEHIRHTIRRRNVVGAGVLEIGDVRFDATSIVINVHNDTADSWFGDLPVGAEIRLHGLTSGARSQYTLDSVTESGDDATLTVTRDSHSGIFSNHETVVLTFDQEHDPQSDWTETDENRPAYIQNKPSRKFFYGEGQSDREECAAGTWTGGDTVIKPFAFTGNDADEEDLVRTFSVPFTDIDDEADADIDKVVATSDNHVFAPDAGTYDLGFEGVGNQTADSDASVALFKIESGTDDNLRVNRPGYSLEGGDEDRITTYSLHYKSLRVESGDKFYLGFLEVAGSPPDKMTGTLILEKLS